MSTTRQIDIRVGAVKRLTKEFKSRIVDIETEKQRTERLIAAGEDRWTVGKQVVPVPKAFSRFAVYGLQELISERGSCGGRAHGAGFEAAA
jgi:hypothetical protein